MATRAGVKRVNGRKVAYVHGGRGDGPWERLYPECRSKSAFIAQLRTELTLPATATPRQVVQELRTKTWDGKRWVNDLSN